MSDAELPSPTWEALDAKVISCRRCPRLVDWREQVAREKRRAYQDWTYWGKPVPGFGDRGAQLLLIGLAPGAHGSNRTGRMFTGDSSGDTLYPALFRAGFTNQPLATDMDDGMQLIDAYITALARCVPPGNKPVAEELANCQPFLIQEMRLLTRVKVVLTLGGMAFNGYLRALGEIGFQPPRLKFQHGVWHELGRGLPILAACYHPSRQNTQTGRLTEAMLDAVFERIRVELRGRGGTR
jgi:uracil-DNA glycosylase family 4